MTKFNDLTGKQFGSWTVLCRGDNSTHGKARWRCLCACGGESLVVGQSLISGASTSCKVCGDIRMADAHVTHGKTHISEYNIWSTMRQRCNNPRSRAYKEYGGRGIKVCDEWNTSFEKFLKDMGMRPSTKHTLDRINNDKGYCKDNCRWVTMIVQANNTRTNINVAYDGRIQTVTQWSRELGIDRRYLHYGVVKLNLSVQEVVRRRAELDSGNTNR